MAASVRIAYDGPEVQGGAMDIAELGPALVAMGDLFYDANRVLNGDRAKLEVRVKAFEHGSFEVWLQCAQTLPDQVQQMLRDDPIKTMTQVVALVTGVGGAGWGVLKFIQWLRGEKPKGEVPSGDGTTIVTRGDGNQTTVNNLVLNLYRDPPLRAAVERMVRPVARNGITSMQVRQENLTVHEVDKPELRYYRADVMDKDEAEKLLDTEYTTPWLQVVRPSFEADLTWTLSTGDGRLHLPAPQAFQQHVRETNMPFAPGDMVHVEMRTTTFSRGGKLRRHHEILRVIEVTHAGVQQAIDWKIPRTPQ